MKIHCVEQGTLEWLLLRLGKPTASEFHRFMTTKFEYRDGEMPKTYLYEKVAEARRRKGLPGKDGGSWATEQGQLWEGKARATYEFESGHELRQVGFIEAQDGLSGCSPDGLCEEHGYGIEIKAPYPQTHVRYLDEGRVPLDYVNQVHGSMFVTGYKEWKFLSWNPDEEQLLLTVPRDEEIMGKIGECIAEFLDRFNKIMTRLPSRQ